MYWEKINPTYFDLAFHSPPKLHLYSPQSGPNCLLSYRKVHCHTNHNFYTLYLQQLVSSQNINEEGILLKFLGSVHDRFDVGANRE